MNKKYSCGHFRPNAVILKSNFLSLFRYMDWKKNSEKCYKCYLKEKSKTKGMG